MPLIHVPSPNIEQPQMWLPLSATTTLREGLAFAVNPAYGPFDSLSNKRAATWNNSHVVTERGRALSNTAAAAKTAEWDFNPIVGSNGNGTGGVTFAVLANPPASASESCLIGIIMNGAPYKQVALYANLDGNAGGGTSGMLSMESYNSTNQGYGNASSVIDGKWHCFIGVFQAGGALVYVDGIDRTTDTGIGPGGGTGDFGIDASSRISVGSESYNATTRAINCQIAYAAGWNRVVTKPEIDEITYRMWELWEDQDLDFYYQPAGAPSSFQAAWARNANSIITGTLR